MRQSICVGFVLALQLFCRPALAEPIKIVQKVSDKDSYIMQPRIYRIETQDYWNEVWEQHSDEQVPHIDFDVHMAVALFIGQSTNTVGVEVLDVRENQNRLEIKYKKKYVQTLGEAMLTAPFGIFVLPKSHQKIFLEEQMYSYQVGRIDWMRTHELKQGDGVLEGPHRDVITLDEHKRRDEETRHKVMNLFADP